MESIKTRFGRFDIYDNYIATTTDKGFEIGVEDLEYTLDVVNEYFGSSPWGLIANRENAYELDMPSLGDVFKDVNLVGLGVVDGKHDNQSGDVWLLETLFVHSFPVRRFTDLDLAKSWMEHQLQLREKS